VVGQMSAAYLQKQFIEHLEKHHRYKVDVYISTYTTPYTNKLLSVYKPKLIGQTIHNERIGIHSLIQKSMSSIKSIKDIQSYDFILFMRIDLCLKPKFLEVFDPLWKTIHFPSVCFKPYHTVGNHPRINDVMLFFPNKYFKYIEHIQYQSTGHSIWNDFVMGGLVTKEDMDMMVDTYHDSDSAKDYNPLYYIVNREQCQTCQTPDEKFDKYHFP
jgi:hypothetical protein